MKQPSRTERVWRGTLIASFIVLGAFWLLSVLPYSFVFNYTESIPRGIYFSEHVQARELRRHDIACYNFSQPDWVRQRRYVVPGVQPCKHVLGMPGDQVVRSDSLLELVTTQGERVSAGTYAKTDSKGRELPAAELPATLPEGMYFMGAPAHERSLDSRYVGLIPGHALTRRLQPLLTW